MRRNLGIRLPRTGLVYFLVISGAFPAAQQGPPGVPVRIEIVKPPRARNNVHRLAPTESIYRVEDKNDRPVGGVVLVATLTSRTGAAGGTFVANGGTTLTQVSDANGIVKLWVQPNKAEGNFELQLSVAPDVHLTVPLENFAGPPPAPMGKVVAITAFAAAVGLAIEMAVNGSGRRDTVVTPGTPPTVGPR